MRPHWTGGGVALGPKPRKYAQRTPKKMIKLALRSALSDRAAEDRVVVVDDWGFDAPKTKAAGAAALERPGLAGRVLVVLQRADEAAAKSFRNLPEVQLIEVGELNAYDVLVQRLGGLHPCDAAGHPGARTRRGGRRLMKDPRDIILRPVVSEKSYALLEANVYTFIVHPEASKPEIHDAVRGHLRREGAQGEHAEPQGQATRNRRTNVKGTRPDTKRALVTLAAGDRIELFES